MGNMSKKITIISVNNLEKSICFKIDGFDNNITVTLYQNNDGLAIEYMNDSIGVPFTADPELIEVLNENILTVQELIEEAKGEK